MKEGWEPKVPGDRRGHDKSRRRFRGQFFVWSPTEGDAAHGREVTRGCLRTPELVGEIGL